MGLLIKLYQTSCSMSLCRLGRSSFAPLALLIVFAHCGASLGASTCATEVAADDDVALLQLETSLRTRRPTKMSSPAFTVPTNAVARQFLIISSPSEKKVVWTTIQNFQSPAKTAFPLIDSGLAEPRGLAFDRKRGHLYIADSGAKKIFRYTILPVISGKTPSLATTGVRLTILQGHPVDSVTIDDAGNLFYTAPDTNSINKIPAQIVEMIGRGDYVASALQIVSEKTVEFQETLASKTRALNKTASNSLTVDPITPRPHIFSLYEAKLNPHVSKPDALWVEGQDLYWVNRQVGTTAGTVVKGESHPKSAPSSTGPTPFPAVALTNVSDSGFGLGKTDNTIFFTRSGKTPSAGLISGLVLGTDIIIDVITDLQSPRALAWDRDNTMYVADESTGSVWSFPCGRLMSDVPVTTTVHMAGAYGLAHVSSEDPAYVNLQVQPSGLAQDGEAPEMSLDNAEQVFLMERSHSFVRSSSRRDAGYASILAMLTIMVSVTEWR